MSVGVLYDVRYGRHETFDRVVFDFRDARPGYRIEYVTPPIVQDGSGLPVHISGEGFLQVRFNVAVAHDDAGQPTYLGPREIFPALPALLEIEQTGDFEAYVTWVIGLPGELPFRVLELSDPYRIALDIKHP